VGHSTMPRAQTRAFGVASSSQCVPASKLGCFKRDVRPTDLQAVGPKPHQKSDTIAAYTAPITSTWHGCLLSTVVRQQETHWNACTPTTSPPTSSAHPVTSKDACWELQHKQPVWSVPKPTTVLEEHAANLC